MSDNTDNKSIEADLEKFRLESRGEIIQKLRMLSKTGSAVSLTFNNGALNLITTIIEVMSDKNLVVMEYSRDENLNKQILRADKIQFRAQYDGVTAQYITTSPKLAKLQGQPVFAFDVPETLLWIQRRESYRARVPMAAGATCIMPLTEGPVSMKVLDISATGLAVHDENTDEIFENDKAFSQCTLNLEDHGSCTVDLRVRNILPINRDNPKMGRRIGCAYNNMSAGNDALIQRYIHMLDAQRRRIDND